MPRARTLLGGLTLLVAASLLPAGPVEAESKAEASAAFLQADWARRTGHWEAAAQAAKRAVSAAPQARAVQHLALKTFIATGRIAQAAALEVKPSRLNSRGATRLALARYAVAWRDGNPRAALAAARAFPESGLGTVLGPPLRAWAASAAGNTQARRQALAHLGDSALDPAFLAYQRALLALRHDDPTAAWLGFGVLAARQGSLQGRARAALDRLATGTRPEAARSGKAGAVLALRQIAQRLDRFRTGGWPADLYAVAVHIQPQRSELALAWGEALARAGRHELAVAAYDGVLAASPGARQAARARIAKARSLIQTDRPEAALKALPSTPAAKLPGGVRARLWGERGDALHDLDRFDAAVAAYEKALAALPEGAPQRRWRLHYRRAWSLDLGGNWPQAEAALQAALELAPDSPTLLNYLGYSWANRGENLARAREMLETAAEARPQASHIADSLGWVLYRQGNYAQAVEQLEKAARLAPANPVVQSHLGDAYWRVGRRREARFQWRLALDVYDGSGRFDPEAARRKLKRGLPADG